jgi:hypothetical protein
LTTKTSNACATEPSDEAPITTLPDGSPVIGKPRFNSRTNHRGLTGRQAAFAYEYVKDNNCTEAMRRLGATGTTATSQGSQLLAKPQVQAEIARLRKEIVKEMAVEQGKSLQELTRKVEEIAFAPEASKAEPADRVLPKDRLKALEILLKMQGAFIDRQEISGPNGAPITVAQKTWVELMAQEHYSRKAIDVTPGE